MHGIYLRRMWTQGGILGVIMKTEKIKIQPIPRIQDSYLDMMFGEGNWTRVYKTH